MIVVAILTLAVAVGTWSLASRIPAKVIDGSSLDIYFSADCSRVYVNMLTRLESDHHRTNVHPLFSIIMHPVFRSVALLTGAGFDEKLDSQKFVRASELLSSLGAAAAMALLYGVFRTIGTPRPDSVVFCLVAAFSAFSLFWFPVPETYAWGSISILAALLVSALGCRRSISPVVYSLASLGTFAITTTNWSVGLLATWTRIPWKKALLWTMLVVGTASGLSITQKLLFPSSWFFFNIAREKNYVMQQHSGGPAASLRSMAFHTVIIPEITTLPHPHYAGKTILRTQGSLPGGGTWTGIAAAAVWITLFTGGIWALATHKGLNSFRITLGLSLAGQFALHSIYGAETFLYSAHFGPMMILCVAFLAQTRFRIPALAGSVALVALMATHNLSHYFQAMTLISRL